MATAPSVDPTHPKLVYYGPHPCGRGCGVTIAKAGNGAPDYLEFDYPDVKHVDGTAFAYPNNSPQLIWNPHNCTGRGSSLFGFSSAIRLLKSGNKVARSGWNGQGMFLELQVPDEHSKMQRPYIFMSPVDGALVPWVASQSDILAEDWYVVQ